MSYIISTTASPNTDTLSMNRLPLLRSSAFRRLGSRLRTNSSPFSTARVGRRQSQVLRWSPVTAPYSHRSRSFTFSPLAVSTSPKEAFKGKTSAFSKSVGLFLSISLNSKGVKRFVAQASEGDTDVPLYSWPDKQRPRVCILGGGFGGLYTALRLESLIWPDNKKPQVLLVDQSDRFVFKPMLYELLSGEVNDWEIAPLFKDLLKNTSVDFVKDRVKLLRPTDNLNIIQKDESLRYGGTVHLESGKVIEYDWLVLALGAEAKVDAVPGSSEYAIPFTTLEDAKKVNNKLQQLERERFNADSSPISVMIVGCGYSGVELAATISERLKNKGIIQAINVGTSLLQGAPPGNREAALKVLQSRKIQIQMGCYVSSIKEETEVIDNETSKKYIVQLQPSERGRESKTLEADLVLWTVGTKPLIPQLEPYALQLNARGQAETDDTLRVKGHYRIFAIGDSAALRDSSGRILPATAQVAFQQADYAGWNLWAAINDRPLLPFRFQNLGEMMTLGTNDAAISSSLLGDITLDGPLGHTARKLAYLWRMPTDEHRAKVGISWFTKSAIDSVAFIQSTLTNVLVDSLKNR